MDGKIDEKGFLVIMRGGVPKEQFCAHSDTVRCGDGCPLFNEPEPDEEYFNEGGYKPSSKTNIELCHNTLVFNDFVDER